VVEEALGVDGEFGLGIEARVFLATECLSLSASIGGEN
jgi:hypothetical protein